MLAQEALDIGPEETAGELEARLAPLGARLALEVVGRIAAGTTQGVKQDKSLVTKAPKLTKEHGLIDWTRPARDVCNQVRAMQPWPTAYTYLHLQDQPPVRLIINKVVERAAREASAAIAGEVTVTQEKPQRLYVAAGAGDRSGEVEILELQPAGKRRMAAAEFLRGHALQPGDRFGPETP
jgi:methionyl-tRNA formyltransferase